MSELEVLSEDSYAAPGFESVARLFAGFLRTDPNYTAELAVMYRSEVVVRAAGGPRWSSDGLTGVFSSSKGVSALTLGTIIDGEGIDLDAPVAEYWPEFGCNGKSEITVRDLLSHQSGLVGVPGGFEPADFLESHVAAEKLAAAQPLWRPRSAHGYHALTIGVFMEELVRRIGGTTLQDLYETKIRRPNEIDFYLGLPESLDHRYVDILPMEPNPAELAELATRPPLADSVAGVAYNLWGTTQIPSPNEPEIRRAGPAAVGGTGTALGLASVYSLALRAPEQGGLFASSTRDAMAQEHASGTDRVIGVEMNFGIVFMKPNGRVPFGSYQAFGHDGAAGSLAYADPMYDLSFGYIPYTMQYPGGADVRSLRLSRLAVEAVRALRG